MLKYFIWALLLLLMLPGAQVARGQHDESSLKSLYESHEWFRLSEAVRREAAPNFFRGAVAASFDQVTEAEKFLTAVIAAEPNTENAYHSHALLAAVYSRHGQYSKSLAHVEAMLAAKPDAEDLRNVIGLIRLLGQGTDQTIVNRRPTRVPMSKENGNLVVPLIINGKSCQYILDTGFNLSGVSESEAKRLGLTARNADTKASGITGAQVGIRIAVAESLRIGKIHLANVAFSIFQDSQPPFDELKPSRRGIIGIPVIMALQTLRRGDHYLEFGFPSRPFDPGDANVAFDGAAPVTEVSFSRHQLQFALDTGAQRTDLYRLFADEFSDLIKTRGQKEQHELTGVSGSARFESVLLPSLNFDITGRLVKLQPAHVLMQRSGSSKWYAGNLGMDLLNQSNSMIIDFREMRLTLR